ncbi:MAG TPA: GatB/YqeY domain-containing protein [Candidatus Anoxymicrobiaceae bacterium]
MDLKEKLTADARVALKAGEKLRLSAIRMLLSDIKNAEIAKKGELTSEELLEIATRDAKKHKESIEEFTKGGRQDLVDKETYELSVIQQYLPKQMSDEEVQNIIALTIEEVGASSPADLGRVMGKLMPRVKGKADGKKINQLVREMLQQ